MQVFDYVIIGAGSAGCVLADHLTRSGKFRVLLLEAGGGDRSPWVRLPIGYGKLFHDPQRNWMFEAAPDGGLMGRRDYWPRGKILGGSSSINALVYVRGLPGDFDDWRDAGNVGWGWSDVEPVFRRLERRVGPGGEVAGEGPLWVSDISRLAHPLSLHFFEAARELGLPATRDMNGSQSDGVGYYQITTRRGLRCSASDAYLRPAMARPNLRVETYARATRIVFDGQRARQIEYRQRGERQSVAVNGEVIVSCGAVGTPQLLQLSGVGPGSVLREFAIDPIFVNEAVGANLQDHLAVSYFYRSRVRTLNDDIRTWRGRMAAAIAFAFRREGWLALSVNQAGGFVRSDESQLRPDLQLYFNPLTYTTETTGKRRLVRPDPFSGFLLSFQPCRPISRGRILLQSPDPLAAPAILPNSLASDRDIAVVVAGGRLMRRFANTTAMRRITEAPIPPDPESLDDDAMIADFRARAGTVYHPVGTCRMAPMESGVVDASLRVYGTEALRVVDASIFPNVTSGNTNAPTIMVGEMAAGRILGAAY